jgi:hypothetical protein
MNYYDFNIKYVLKIAVSTVDFSPTTEMSRQDGYYNVSHKIFANFQIIKGLIQKHTL